MLIFRMRKYCENHKNSVSAVWMLFGCIENRRFSTTPKMQNKQHECSMNVSVEYYKLWRNIFSFFSEYVKICRMWKFCHNVCVCGWLQMWVLQCFSYHNNDDHIFSRIKINEKYKWKRWCGRIVYISFIYKRNNKLWQMIIYKLLFVFIRILKIFFFASNKSVIKESAMGCFRNR